MSGAATSTNFAMGDVELRAVNAALHQAESGSFTITDPKGAHALAVGVDRPLEILIAGSVGYYCAGMNHGATITVEGNAGTGLAENMESGVVRITGNSTMSAGATGLGGLLVIEGNAGARCGISMKGIDIVVGGNVGHMSAFMAQAGNLVVLGDAAEDLGDSIYEADLYVAGKVASLGSDCEEKPMEGEHENVVAGLLAAAGMEVDPGSFRRFGSARNLYNFHVDDIDGELAGGELADGELAGGELADGELAGGELADGELAGGEPNNGEAGR